MVCEICGKEMHGGYNVLQGTRHIDCTLKAYEHLRQQLTLAHNAVDRLHSECATLAATESTLREAMAWITAHKAERETTNVMAGKLLELRDLFSNEKRFSHVAEIDLLLEQFKTARKGA